MAKRDGVKPDEPAGDGTGGVSDTLQLFSHDIRSAMSDVIGGLRLVDPDRLDPEARLQIERVRPRPKRWQGLWMVP